jgi:hypothetical protein
LALGRAGSQAGGSMTRERWSCAAGLVQAGPNRAAIKADEPDRRVFEPPFYRQPGLGSDEAHHFPEPPRSYHDHDADIGRDAGGAEHADQLP